MAEVFIFDALRTPRGRGGDKGALRAIKPVDLLAEPLRALASRHGFDTREVTDGVFGCVTQTADQGANIGKLALVRAGYRPATSE